MLFISLFLFYPFPFAVLFTFSLKFLVFLFQILIFETQTFFSNSRVFLDQSPVINSLSRAVLSSFQKSPFSFLVIDLFPALTFL